TNQGVGDLVALDPGASSGSGAVTGSCAETGSCTPPASYSPRIVPISVFDMDEFQWRSIKNDWTTAWVPGVPGTPGTSGHPDSSLPAFSCPIGGRCVRITNILGFFVEGVSGGGDVTGRIVTYPGDSIAGSTTVAGEASFLKD